MGAIQAGMRRKQECDLDLQTGDGDLVFTVQQARGGHRGVEPTRNDTALDDAALGMPFDRMAVALFGMPFDRNAIQELIIADPSYTQKLPCRRTASLDLPD